MTKLSAHAHAAKLIRQEIKKHGLEARVRSESYAGGNAVTVTLYDAAPWTFEAVETFAKQFQQGHFDGMVDIYEYSNRRDDIPQVKYVFVQNDISDELRAKAWTYLRGYMAGYDELPESYQDAQNCRGAVDWISSEVHRVLRGSMGKFWIKPRVTIEAAA